jgi:hypothetical protein
MSRDSIRRTLAERAEDVASIGPDLDTLHARVAAERRQRRLRAAGTSVALVAVVAGAALLGTGRDAGAPDPAPAPSVPTPTPTQTWTSGEPLPRRTEPVEVLPTPYDRETVGRARVLTRLRNAPGDPTLEWTVDRSADVTFLGGSCRGAPGALLVVFGGSGTSTAVPCDGSRNSSGPEVDAMPLQLNFSPVLPEVGEQLTAVVTTNRGRVNKPEGTEKDIPARTSAEFEVVVWGLDRPRVATLLGRDVSPLGTSEPDRDWWFISGLEAPNGADSLTLELPASPVDRVVQTVTDYARFRLRGTLPFVQVFVDGRPVDHRYDPPRVAFQDETSAFVPAGGPHTVVLRVTDGRPQDVDFAAAVFEAGEER